MKSNDQPATQHEEFSVATEPSPSGKRLHLVREDRFEVTSWQLSLHLNDDTFEVINYSMFGLAIFSEKLIEEKEHYFEVPLVLEGIEINRLNLCKVRHEPFGNNGFKIAFEVQGEPINLTRVEGIIKAKTILAERNQQTTTLDLVPEDFRRGVYELKDELEQLESAVNELVDAESMHSRTNLEAFEEAISDVVSAHLHALLEPSYVELNKTIDGLQPNNLKACFEFFKSKLKHLIYQSPLSDRIFSKPLGYAGDFEMMNFIYRNENVGRTLFSKCLHRYFIEHPNARAVKNRAVYLKDKILTLSKKHPDNLTFTSLSVASGPAQEVQLIMEEKSNTKNIEFHLLDQDLLALKDAQRGIRSLSRKTNSEFNVHYFHKAIKNILTEGLSQQYDLIYSAGLFDYFSDPVARMAAKKLYSAVKPGGCLIIGNFTAKARNTILMELALDWHLIYRTESDLKDLYGDLASDITVESEPEGINLFVVLLKK